MQSFPENAAMTASPPLPAEWSADGSGQAGTCSATSRIVMISPHPSLLNPLVLALTARCYDVMVFHRADDPMLMLLNGDLLILDMTRPGAEMPKLSASFAGMPSISLVSDEGAYSSVGSGMRLRWPSPIEDVLAEIEAAADPSNRFPFTVPGRLFHKDLVLDLGRMTVQRNGSRIETTKTEFDLLKALFEAGGQVLTRQKLMDLVWGDEYFGGSNSVDVHIKSLRRKLDDDPRSPRYIATVRGVGYRLAD